MNGTTPEGASPEVGGLLEWGVKAAFRRYVRHLPDGLCDISPEIALPGQGRFGFPRAGADGTPPTRYRFTGAVTFRGHGDLLFVTIAEPWLIRDGGTWRLSCLDPASAADRLELASGRAADGPASELRIPLRLSHVGAGLFGGSYPPGEPLDDLIVRRTGTPAHHP